MNKLVIAVCICMLITCASHAQVYKWTDSQGIVHFSDKPHQGSEQLKIPETQSYSSPKPQSKENSEVSETPDQIDNNYTKLAIQQPLNEATIRNNQGYVVVTVEIEPNLIAGDSLQLIFDETPVGKPQLNKTFQLNGVYRGSHKIAVQILDKNGKEIMKSEPITIFMHRPRVNMVHPNPGN